MKHQTFDFDEALKALKEGKPLSGKDGILTPLIKELTEAALEGEIESHLLKETSPTGATARAKNNTKHSGKLRVECPKGQSGHI